MPEPDFTRVGVAGAWFLLVFGVLLPWSAIRSGRRIRSGAALPGRRKHFVTTTIVLLVFLGLSLSVAHFEYVPLGFDGSGVSRRSVVLGIASLAGLVAFMWPRWKRAVERDVPILELFSPRDATERALWTCVSAAAAVSEEVTYRGVLFVLLWRLTGQPLAAALLGALAFGAAHMMQGWKGAAIIIVFGLVFQALAYESGSLYVPIAVHLVYDVIAGLAYGRLVRARGAARVPTAT